MNLDSKKKNFSKLSDEEKKSKFFIAVNNKLKLTIWEKGQKNFRVFSIIDLKEDKLILGPDSNYENEFDQVLFYFELNNVRYFGKSKILAENDDTFIEINDDLYKHEKRSSHRIMTFPIHNIYLFIQTEIIKPKSNVIELKLGRSLDDVFDEFLDQLNDQDKDLSKNGYISFRVMDISTRGASIHIGDLEKEILQDEIELGRVYVNFNGQEVEIQKSKVVYLKEINSKVRNLDVIKVGIQFLEIEEKNLKILENLIDTEINEETSEFESFV